MWRRYFGPRFGAGILLVLAACSGEKFGERADETAGGSGGKATQAPRNSTDEGTFDHPVDQLPVTPQGGAADAGAGGNDSGGTQPLVGLGGASGGDATSGGAGGDSGESDGACVPVLEDWSQQLDTDARWSVAWGDPEVDTANRRLVLGWDDVAKHNKVFNGGYYVTADVTLTGTTPLTVYPESHEGVWPSLRVRNGTLELGGAVYGQDQVWRTTTWPGFSEVQIPGTNTVRVTFYVKAKEKAAAAKVSYGDGVWRTGWITGLNAPDTNLGVFRYVGMNNSGANPSEQSSIYVGSVSGCEGLSDAAVQAAFQN